MNRGIWKKAVDYPGVYGRPIRRNAGDNRWMRRKVEGKSLYVPLSISGVRVEEFPTSRSHDIPYVKYSVHAHHVRRALILFDAPM